MRFSGDKLLNVLTKIATGGRAMGKGEAALEFGPDIVMAALTAATLPEGVDPVTRAGAGLEDLAYGLGGSLGGRFLGRRGAGLFRPGDEAVARGIEQMGGMLGGIVPSMMAPRPILNQAIEQAYKREGQRELAKKDEQQGESNEALADALLRLGYAGAAGDRGIAPEAIARGGIGSIV
jgi:hypothetical protein